MTDTMPVSPPNSDDEWLTDDEVSSSSESPNTNSSGKIYMSGQIVASIDSIPNTKGGGEATILTKSLNLKHRYRVLQSTDVDKTGHPTPEVVGDGQDAVICSDGTGQFLGMLIDTVSAHDDSQPAIAPLSKKSEFHVAKCLIKNKTISDAIICKWASLLETSPKDVPKDVRAAVAANHNYLVASHLVAKRKKDNANRAQKAHERKAVKRSGQGVSTKKLDKNPPASPNVAAKRPNEDDKPSIEKKEVTKSETPASVPTKTKPQFTAEPPPEPKRRKVTITIENATIADMQALIRGKVLQ